MVVNNPFYIALDTSDWKRFQYLVDTLLETNCGFKVGMEAYYGLGERCLDYLDSKQSRVFLDLKLHDIPNTVSRGIVNLASRFQPELINIHCSGGAMMMKETASALKDKQLNTKLIGVTVLTSLTQGDLNDMWSTPNTVDQQVLNLALISKESGLDGIVCSAQESFTVKNQIADFLTITPGIRMAGKDVQDQKRVLTPFEAKNNLADYLVIGRGITASDDILKTYSEYEANYNG